MINNYQFLFNKVRQELKVTDKSFKLVLQPNTNFKFFINAS